MTEPADLPPLTYDTDRDPRVDHYDELYPEVAHVEDTDQLVVFRHGVPEPVVGDNVDNDGVAHFLLISPDPDVPDMCGGCAREWPCGHGVPLQVLETPQVDPELVAAVAAALRKQRESGQLA